MLQFSHRLDCIRCWFHWLQPHQLKRKGHLYMEHVGKELYCRCSVRYPRRRMRRFSLIFPHKLLHQCKTRYRQKKTKELHSRCCYALLFQNTPSTWHGPGTEGGTGWEFQHSSRSNMFEGWNLVGDHRGCCFSPSSALPRDSSVDNSPRERTPCTPNMLGIPQLLGGDMMYYHV